MFSTIMKIKKGDTVVITAGKDKGKRGTVTHTLPSHGRVVVEGLNIRKKHAKTRKEGEKGQRVEVAFPLDVSNVMLICPHTDRPTRVKYRMNGDQKVRVSKRADKEI